ncbi:triosephosphate isomerase [bacterium]|nr:triosephosphate isomerase [bacterium]
MRFIVANWKSGMNATQIVAFQDQWNQKSLTWDEDVRVVIAPPDPHYVAFYNDACAGVYPCLQHISALTGAAHTGSITPETISDCLPSYTILGHSERRREYGEDNRQVLAQAQILWQLQIEPIICVDADTFADMFAQIEAFDPHLQHQCLFAYEPAGAIGTGHNLDPQELDHIIGDFRRHHGDFFPVLYGGSVTPDNAASYAPYCDGLLVGGASRQADSFYQIIHNFIASDQT